MKNGLLITTGVFPPEIGGPATYVFFFSQWMMKNNYDLTVVTALKEKPSESLSFPVEVVKKRGKIFWHLRVFLKIFKYLKKCDVIYINGLFIESFFACFFRKKKVVYRIVSDQVWEKAERKNWTKNNFIDFQSEKGNIKIKFFRRLRKFYLNRADKIIIPSLILSKSVEQWGIKKDKIVIIPNPYSDLGQEEFNLSADIQDKFVMVTGGRLIPLKGIDSIIKVLREIKKGFLIIFGDGPERRNLEKLAGDLNVSEQILFTGIISQSKLKYLFKLANCFVLNSKHEGLPHIILEAMAVGCPVIATNMGGIPEIIHDNKNGILIESDNIPAIMEAIERLKENSSYRDQIIEYGRKTVTERFNPDIVFPEVVKILFRKS